MIDCHLAAAPQLDPKHRPGYKMELIGFDFLLDEDLRVWLIEVNTCPFMGPVLTKDQPNFMRDLLNDTFKITLDKHFFDVNMTNEEVASQTEYEFLTNSDGSSTVRSSLGLETPATPDSSSKHLVHLKPSLYPSESIHSSVT